MIRQASPSISSPSERKRLPTRPAWTSVAQLIDTLNKRWLTGRYLRERFQQNQWEPIVLSIKGPSASEILDHLAEAQAWSTLFSKEISAGIRSTAIQVEYRNVKGRNLGVSTVPSRVTISSFEHLCQILGTEGDVIALENLIETTLEHLPPLVNWIVAHPLVALEHRNIWMQLLLTVEWIIEHNDQHLYLRQIDVKGVDTKFIELHRKLLDQLLTLVLPQDRVDSRYTSSDFARRFGFLSKPTYTRFRLLATSLRNFPSRLSEIALRTDELATLDIDVDTVFIVENEISYLAFPGNLRAAIVVFGSGFALAQLKAIPWLHSKEIVYWGDIDTHGFSILNHLRSEFREVKSILMDRDTLLTHKSHWVGEPSPTNQCLEYLNGDEMELYKDLVEDRYAEHVRLEQERVRFSYVDAAVARWHLT